MNKKNNDKVLNWHKSEDLSSLRDCLRQESIFLGSTDTILGLFAPATKNGLQLLDRLKGRQEKPYLLLINSLNCIKNFIDSKNFFQIEKIAELFFPGPLTIVVQAQKGTPEYLVSHNGTLAFRMPDHSGIQALLKEVPLIFSTSINKTGKPAALKIEDIEQDFLDEAHYIVLDELYDQGLSGNKPSTIIKIDAGNIELIREGALSFEDVLSSIDKK